MLKPYLYRDRLYPTSILVTFSQKLPQPVRVYHKLVPPIVDLAYLSIYLLTYLPASNQLRLTENRTLRDLKIKQVIKTALINNYSLANTYLLLRQDLLALRRREVQKFLRGLVPQYLHHSRAKVFGQHRRM